MNSSLRQIIISTVAVLVTISIVVVVLHNPARLGSEPLINRALLVSLAIVSALIAIYPFAAFFTGRPGTYATVVFLPVFVLVLIYYLYFLPSQAGEGLSVEQLESQLITDSSSNGIIEVGFSYPIYTPTLSIINHELFTRRVNVFLRMVDGNGEIALFRAAREEIPGSGLTVEATVRGMLSENDGYEFIPIDLPPNRSVTAKVVFVISNLDVGKTFTDALTEASQVQFELRDPENGDLLVELPATRF